MSHDMIIPQYIVIRCILRYIVIFCIGHWKCENRAEVQVAVYDLNSRNTSLYFDTSADKLSQNNFFLKFPFQFTEHTDEAAKTSKWEIKFKCTLHLTGHTEIENMKVKCMSVLLCHWTLGLGFNKDFRMWYVSRYMGHNTIQLSRKYILQCITISVF